MTPKRRKGAPPAARDPLPPSADPAEAVERIVSRRQLIFQDGDVVIVRIPGGLSATTRSVYQLRLRGKGPVPGRFANFDHAVAAGDQLATQRRVRLFYIDSDAEHEIPHLLKDYRPPAS